MAKDDERQEAYELIREFAEGDMNTELSNAIATVVELVKCDAINRGREATVKGEVTLKIKFAGQNQSGRDVLVDTTYEIARKEPKPVRSAELFFVDGKKLVREQPRQGVIDFPVGGKRVN